MPSAVEMTTSGIIGDLSNTSSGLTAATTHSTMGSIYEDVTKEWDDATWILTSSFIIFTMQSGFGMLESGCVNRKNELNIMMKNVADVIIGGLSYWMLGYGFSFGNAAGSNGFCGLGRFFLDPAEEANMGWEYSRFVFQASFATTATTIVSGAMAERTRFSAYLVFSFFNTFVYCFPAHWVWADMGWLKVMGVVDVAGDGPVHIVGGFSALVAAIMLKPRKGRYTEHDTHQMESPVGAVLGLFILWWSWLAFNCGSTFGISGGKWKVASRAAANTLMSANTGGVVAFLGSFLIHRTFHVQYVINGILAALVSITACCSVTSVKLAMLIGGVGATLTLVMDHVMNRLKVDDPVSAFAVHGVGGAWGLLAAGLFVYRDTVTNTYSERDGLVQGGGFTQLGVQALEMVAIASWTVVTSIILFKIIDLTIGIRLSPEDEELGADLSEHGYMHHFIHRKASLAAAARGAVSLPQRAVHLNPAYGVHDETDSDGVEGHATLRLSGPGVGWGEAPMTGGGRRRQVFAITSASSTSAALRASLDIEAPTHANSDPFDQHDDVEDAGRNGNSPGPLGNRRSAVVNDATRKRNKRWNPGSQQGASRYAENRTNPIDGASDGDVDSVERRNAAAGNSFNILATQDKEARHWRNKNGTSSITAAATEGPQTARSMPGDPSRGDGQSQDGTGPTAPSRGLLLAVRTESCESLPSVYESVRSCKGSEADVRQCGTAPDRHNGTVDVKLARDEDDAADETGSHLGERRPARVSEYNQYKGKSVIDSFSEGSTSVCVKL